MTTAGARALSRLTSLGIINLTESKQVVVCNGDFPALQKLTLEGLREERLASLAPLFHSTVTEVKLMGTSRTPLSTLLRSLSELRSLVVVGGHGGSVVSLLTGRLRRLSLLILRDCNLEDRHARNFSQLHSLRVLGLDRNLEITGAFLRPLTGLTKLSNLSLEYCPALLPSAVPSFCSRIDAARSACGWPPLKVMGLGSLSPMDSLWDSGSDGFDPFDALDPSWDDMMGLYGDEVEDFEGWHDDPLDMFY